MNLLSALRKLAVQATPYWSVPYVPQTGIGSDEHHNDCGAASSAMIIKFFNITCPAVDALYNEVSPNGDAYLSYANLFKLLDTRGIDADYFVLVSNGELYEYLTRGTPVIALIHYGSLETIRPNSFKGAHFVVVIGMDMKYVYIHDPLSNISSGECIQVPIALWNNCWTTTDGDNPQRSCLVPNKTVSPTVLKVVYPRDTNGCTIRSVPGVTTSGRLYYIIYDPTFTRIASRMLVYEIREVMRDGILEKWGRISPTQQHWVCLTYTREGK
jgi:hypothetical protein